MWRTNNRYTLQTRNSTGAFHSIDSNGLATSQNMLKSSAFRNQGFTVITTGFTGTITFHASNADQSGVIPNLSNPANTSNEHSVAQSSNLQDWSNISGIDWLVLTADTSVTRYELNDNNNNFVGASVTAYTWGTVEVKVDFTDNQ